MVSFSNPVAVAETNIDDLQPGNMKESSSPTTSNR